MNSPEFIRSTLVSRTNADCSSQEVKNNRYHFYLKFEEDIGWSWIQQQVGNASAELETNLELYKIRPSGVASFEVEVRELQRREGIDDSQRDFSSFES